MNIHFFKLASFFYFLGALAYLAYVLFLKDHLSKLALTIVSVGFASHTLALITRYAEAGHTPVTNLHESLSFFAWMMTGVLLIVNLKYRVKILGAFITPIALILMLFAFTLPAEILPLAPVLRSLWHPFQVVFAFLGNAIFAVAFCCGVMESDIVSEAPGGPARRRRRSGRCRGKMVQPPDGL